MNEIKKFPHPFATTTYFLLSWCKFADQNKKPFTRGESATGPPLTLLLQRVQCGCTYVFQHYMASLFFHVHIL